MWKGWNLRHSKGGLVEKRRCNLFFNCPQDRVGIVERADQSKRRRFQSQHVHNHRHHGTMDDGSLIHSVTLSGSTH